LGGEARDEIATAIGVAYRIGLAPSEFLALTPWHFGELVKAFGEQQGEEFRKLLWQAWHSAALGKTDPKTFPKLDKLMARKSGKKAEPQASGIDEGALFRSFKRYNKRQAKRNGA
jgi:hypothetical protein